MNDDQMWAGLEEPDAVLYAENSVQSEAYEQNGYIFRIFIGFFVFLLVVLLINCLV